MCPISSEQTTPYALTVLVLCFLLLSAFCIFLSTVLCFVDYICALRYGYDGVEVKDL